MPPNARGVLSLRRDHGLRRLLAVLLILQAVLAPSLCLARVGGQGMAVELCTPDGMRLVRLDGEGREAPPAKAGHDAGCLACHALPQAVAVPAPFVPPPAWIALGTAWAPTGLAAPPPAIRGPPFGPRAPPTLLS